MILGFWLVCGFGVFRLKQESGGGVQLEWMKRRLRMARCRIDQDYGYENHANIFITGTVIRPPNSKLPSIISEPKDRLEYEWGYIKALFSSLVGYVYPSPPYLKLQTHGNEYKN